MRNFKMGVAPQYRFRGVKEWSLQSVKNFNSSVYREQSVSLYKQMYVCFV